MHRIANVSFKRWPLGGMRKRPCFPKSFTFFMSSNKPSFFCFPYVLTNTKSPRDPWGTVLHHYTHPSCHISGFIYAKLKMCCSRAITDRYVSLFLSPYHKCNWFHFPFRASFSPPQGACEAENVGVLGGHLWRQESHSPQHLQRIRE